MKYETKKVTLKSGVTIEDVFDVLWISIRDVESKQADVVVGSSGQGSTLHQNMKVGDCMSYPPPDRYYEIRLLSIENNEITLAVTKLI